MNTNYIVCSSKTDITPIGSKGGSTGLKYPWLDRMIPVGGGFFVERTEEILNSDKGRPCVPTKRLAEYGMAYKTYKSKRGNAFGYFCERTK